MLIRLHSDLHLEGFYGRDAETLSLDFIPPDYRDTDSILVLAGDISSHGPQVLDFIEVCRQRFKYVLYIPGNHEYYRHNYDTYGITLDHELIARYGEASAQVFWAINCVTCTDIDGVRFIYGTLWGDGGPTIADQAKTGWFLNDFRLIKRNTHTDPSYRQIERLFTVGDMVTTFKEHRDTIDTFLRLDRPEKTVVVTHHLPSRRLVSPRFKEKDGSDGANGGFVGDCEFILAYDHAPDLWLHGHTHDFIDMKLWNTRVVCNPTGYRGEWDNGLSGTNNFFIEV
jgi:hypothetical protein